MLSALEMAVLERFLVKHSQETLGVNYTDYRYIAKSHIREG
jgi:hypothetical protein